MFLKRALMFGLIFAGIVAIAVSPHKVAADENFESGQQLSGSYYVSVLIDGAPPVGPFIGLVTYNREGTAIANEITPLGPLAGATLTEDHGGWHRLGNKKFAVSFVKLASLNGNFVAYIKNRATVELTQDGDKFSGRFRTDILKPDGVTVLFSVPGTITGKRIPVEPFPG